MSRAGQMEHMTQFLYTYRCKIKIYIFEVLELFNTTYFTYYVIFTNEIKQSLEIFLFAVCVGKQVSSLP
jgi:hypothetical protein